MRPGLPALADEIIAAIAEAVPEYDRPMRGEFGRAVRTGVRYTGMPAWSKALSTEDMWKVTAFLSHLDKLPPAVQTYWKNAYGVAPRSGEEHHEHGAHEHGD